jgi:hypothetical protein
MQIEAASLLDTFHPFRRRGLVADIAVYIVGAATVTPHMPLSA